MTGCRCFAASDLNQAGNLTGVCPLRQTYILPRKRHSKTPPLQRGDGPQGTIALQEYEITMKAKSRENNFRRTLRKTLRRRAPRHDPMLVLNMSIFNFTDGWSRTFSKHEYARSYA